MDAAMQQSRLQTGFLIMSEITIVYFGDDQKVGRCQMIIDCLPENIQIISKRHWTDTLVYIIKLIQSIFTAQRLIILNRKTCLLIAVVYPLILIRRKVSDLKLYYDMWEFYTFKEHTSFKSRIGTLIEIFILKRADKVIVCNKYRKRLVKLFYNVHNIEVIENFRILKDHNENIDTNLAKKFDHLNSNRHHFIITNGFSIERNDINLIECFSNNKDVTMTFVGSMSDKDAHALQTLKAKLNFENIYFVETVPYKFLTKILPLFDFGVVNYSSRNLNNKYCASGKIYEFLALGLPVITSNNISLKSFVNNNCVGLSTASFTQELHTFLIHRNEYKKHVSKLNIEEMYGVHKTRANEVLTGE